jgi:hypothetical protein
MAISAVMVSSTLAWAAGASGPDLTALEALDPQGLQAGAALS